MQEYQCLSGVGDNDAHVAYHPNGAVGAGEQYQITRAGVFNVDGVVNIRKINRHPRNEYPEMIKYIGNKAGAIETPFSID